MRMLLVDDDENFLEAVVPELEKITGADNLKVARSRNSARAALDAASYDVFVLDLKIPTVDGGLDEAVEHGQAVFHQVHACAPRTPVYFLTGSSADEVVTDLLRHAERVDVWGERRPIPTVQLLRKTKLAELLQELRLVAKCITDTDEIEIVTKGMDLQLNSQQKRVLRVFTRRQCGCSCGVAALAGGLSGSRVFRITVCDSTGHTRIFAAGKIADLDAIDDEVQRFDQHVQRLRPGAFPQKVEVVRAGASLTAGVFYRLLDAYEHSLFSLLDIDPERAAAALVKVKELTDPWFSGVPTTQKRVSEIRGRLLTDEKAAELVAHYGLSWASEFEARRIQTRWACLHGDLHGGNILVDGGTNPILIDFGDVGVGAASIDPITLELSLIFHPAFQRIRGTWPTAENAAAWSDRKQYTDRCPVPAFVSACRGWSHGVAAGDREVYASAYAYLLRQLKYPETDKDLVLAFLNSVRHAFQSTYG